MGTSDENKTLKPFSLSALEKLADIVADYHTGSGITELPREGPTLSRVGMKAAVSCDKIEA